MKTYSFVVISFIDIKSIINIFHNAIQIANSA